MSRLNVPIPLPEFESPLPPGEGQGEGIFSKSHDPLNATLPEREGAKGRDDLEAFKHPPNQPMRSTLNRCIPTRDSNEVHGRAVAWTPGFCSSVSRQRTGKSS